MQKDQRAAKYVSYAQFQLESLPNALNLSLSIHGLHSKKWSEKSYLF